MERVTDFQFLGVQIKDDLSWAINTTELFKKASQRRYIFQRPRGLKHTVLCVLFPWDRKRDIINTGRPLGTLEEPA